MRRSLFSWISALALAAVATACAEPKAPDQWAPVNIVAKAVPLEPDRPSVVQAGLLTYRGGLELSSSSALFGGFSGISVSPDGRTLVAMSDAGIWFTADIVTDPSGQLVGLEQARIAQMRDEAGQPLQGKQQSDAEDLARMPDGRYAVSFEQDHRILLFDLDRKGPFAPAERGPVVGGTKGMHPNEGLEALAAMPDGSLIGIAEHAPRGAGSPFWVWPPGAAVASPVGRANRPQGFGISGLATLPNGDLISVERFYLPFVGVRVSIRLIPAANLKQSPPNADGPVLAALEPPMTLDNVEGIAVAPGPNGLVRLYLISDNNFSANQRTLLYAFDWAPTPALAAPIPAPVAVIDPTAPAADSTAPPQLAEPAAAPGTPAVAAAAGAAAAALAAKPVAVPATPVAAPVAAPPPAAVKVAAPKPTTVAQTEPPKPAPKATPPKPRPKPRPKPVEPPPAAAPVEPPPRASAGPPA